MVAAGCSNQIPTDPFNNNAAFTFNGQTNVIDPARLSPAGVAYLSQFPTPTRSNPCANNWVTGVTIPVDWRAGTVRGGVKMSKTTPITSLHTQDSWYTTRHSDGGTSRLG